MSTEIILQNIILIYSWVMAGIIMVFIAAIARFYQKKFGVKTFYYFYFIPVLFIFAAILNIYLYNTYPTELVELFGAVISFIAVLFLYIKMVGVK
jgi:hypothetical protein